MFQSRCFFYQPRLAGAPPAACAAYGEPPGAPALPAIRAAYDLLLAVDTGPGARNLLAYQPPPGARLAVFVGNERRGLSPALLRQADALLQIPMRGPQGQSLNVAGAAAVALAHLTRAGVRQVPGGRARRPALVLLHPTDPAELGSTLRTAWALGWDQVQLIDSRRVWFTPDRAVYAQGRGAARRHKNPLRVLPGDLTATPPPFAQALVVTRRGPGPPLWRTRLRPGPATAVVLPDESAGPPDGADYQRLARQVQYATLDLPNPAAPYHYRLVTAIVLAELARRLA